MSNFGVNQSQVGMVVDQTEFRQALKQLIALGREKIPQIINRKALFISLNARNHTYKADRATIEHDLGVVAYKLVRSKKTGLIRRGGFITKYTRAENIIKGRRAKAGEDPLSNKELRQAGRKMIGKRLRAVGSIRAGWNGAIKTLARVIGSAPNVFGPRVRLPGYAVVARDGWNSVAEIHYDLKIKQNSSTLQIPPDAIAALGAAFNQETAVMREYIAKHLQPVFDKVSAK